MISIEWQQLQNAVKNPCARLSAVKIDTIAFTYDIISKLKSQISKRPYEIIEFTPQYPDNAHKLLKSSTEKVKDWQKEQGVLFLVDKGRGTEKEKVEFFRTLNFQREMWDALQCHVIFFLLPQEYKLLLTEADHLADWMFLKIQIFQDSESKFEKHKNELSDVSNISYEDIKTAKARLKALEELLIEAIQEEIPQKFLTRRYYLPMFKCAVILNDLTSAKALAKKCKEEDMVKSDLPIWWVYKSRLNLKLRNFTEAKNNADNLLTWAKKNNDAHYKANAFYLFGRIVQAQKEFESAEKWYRKSLEIKERIKQRTRNCEYLSSIKQSCTIAEKIL
ncbi:hypothetical protein GMMP15_670023 [Candidatus Magnetomoraceae bacterium gMMP-15]